MADLTRDNILKLARLSRISLSDDEVATLMPEIQEIIKYVEILNEVDTTGLVPTSQVTGLIDVTRPDQIIDYGYTAADLMANVPAVEADHIKVRRMVG